MAANTYDPKTGDNIPGVLIDIFRRPAGDAVLSAADILKALGGAPPATLLAAYANNATARAAGLVTGQLYRTGADPDVLCIVHDAP